VQQLDNNIMIHNEALVQTKYFVYFGSTISDDARLDEELTLRMGKASAAYEKLRRRLGQPTRAPSSEMSSI